MTDILRCAWETSDPLYIHYHDHEWGVPVRDETHMFEFLVLETFQSGLSWITILKRRDAFRAAFDQFDAEKIARYNQADIDRLLKDATIIRNRRKIEAAIANARATMALRESGSGLADYLWDFVDGTPIQNNWTSHDEIPAFTDLSTRISKDMKQRGFQFVGPTVMYAHMQAAGLVNDHIVNCFRHTQIQIDT